MGQSKAEVKKPITDVYQLWGGGLPLPAVDRGNYLLSVLHLPLIALTCDWR